MIISIRRSKRGGHMRRRKNSMVANVFKDIGDFWKVIPTFPKYILGRPQKVVFYQVDRAASIASKIFSTTSRDMIWVFEGLQIIMSIFWNKRGGRTMRRTDSTDANVGPWWFFEFHTRSSVLNWVSKNGDIPQKSEFFAFFRTRRARKSCPHTSNLLLKVVKYLVEALQKILWQ